MEFAQDIADMPLDRVLANDQLRCDLVVAQAAGDQFEHIQFPLGQVGEQGLFSYDRVDIKRKVIMVTNSLAHSPLYKCLRS